MGKNTREVKIGNVSIGAGNPVAVQSMLNKPINDIAANVAQAISLRDAGCDIARVTVPSVQDAAVITAIKNAVDMPIVADIHFDYKAAIACVDAGVDKIRLNPGNIGADDNVKAVANACNLKNIPIRIGVNSGSLEKNILAKYGGVTAEGLCESALYHVSLLEKHDFNNIVISIKSANVPLVIAAYRQLSKMCNYPLHVGVTEAGTYRTGLIKSAMGIGALLLEGIGDTIRVSLTDAPEKEVQAGFDILRAAGYPVAGAEVISCPTCGRTNIDIVKIANEVEERLHGYKKHIKVAVMGCIVNGPGEASEADIGIAGGKDCAMLFVKGVQKRMLRGDIVGQLIEEIMQMG
ncbi:MAG: flavodoxin-dependent (E)-4-hydroxy-3-methylbut-2-enyl-diphosphate synthase [Oscillospiraceae bacterium]